MLKQLKAAFRHEGMDMTPLPLTGDAGDVSQELRERLHQGGCSHSIMAGKGHDVLTIDGQKQEASTWKKDLIWQAPTWGMDVPSCRLWGESPTCGALVLFFCRTSTTRRYSLMHFRQVSLRGAEIGHMWQQPHVMECFWKMMQAIFPSRSMQGQGDGLDTALLLKVFASLLALRLQGQSVLSQLTITQIMRTWSREHDFREFLATHFHAPFSTT